MEVNIVFSYQTQNGKTALMLASKCGSIECMRLILDAGADMNIRDSKVRLGVNVIFVSTFEPAAPLLHDMIR